MEILKTFTQRMEKVGLSHDPIEGKALTGWLEAGGLESLKVCLLGYVQDVTQHPTAPWTITVYRFDDWTEYPFEAFPYSTMEELQQLVGDNFGIKGARLALYANLVPRVYQPWETLGEVLGTTKVADVRFYVLPQVDEPFGTAKFLNIPVRISTKDEKQQDLLIPITQQTTVGGLSEVVRKILPTLKYDVEFVNVTGIRLAGYQYNDHSIAWKLWQQTSYGYVTYILH